MKTMSNKNSIAETNSMVTNKRQIGKLEQILGFLPFIKNQKYTIAVLRLTGIIGKVSTFKSGLSLETLNTLIEKTFELQKLVAVALVINSPGGSPVQSELIAKRIRFLAKEKQIPVYSFVEDVAASGGYWLACAGDEIYASKSSVIGSIGVISSGFGFEDAIKKLGIERRVYTEGKNKSILDPFQATKPSDIKIIKQLQKQVHENFVNYIKDRRIGKLTQNDDILFSGEFWAGQIALDFGLIDGIQDMYSFIKDKYGEDVKIEYMSSKQSWLKRKFGIVNQNLSQELANSLIESFENKIVHGKFDLK